MAWHRRWWSPARWSAAGKRPRSSCAGCAEEPKLLERDELAPGGPWNDLVAWTNAEGDQRSGLGRACARRRSDRGRIDRLGRRRIFRLPRGRWPPFGSPEGIAVGEGELCWLVKPKLID